MEQDIPDDQDKAVNRLLLESVETANYERISLCLKKGADINTRNAQGRTPLMLAVWHERPELAQFLLTRQPDLFLKDNGGKNAFDLIAEVREASRRESITDIMLRALPDRARRKGASPAEAAALAEAANDLATASDISVPRPVTFTPKSGKGGFKL
jgi:ankyrin repeat protein